MNTAMKSQVQITS